MTLQRAILEIDNPFPKSVRNSATAEFHMVGDLEITQGLRTGFLVGGKGSTVNSILSGALSGTEKSRRQGFYLDLGGGQHTVKVDFRGWDGATDGNGNALQWGDNPNVAKSKTSATGQDAIVQMQVLMKYLTLAEIDSRNPAVLEVGEYSSNGLYEPLEVVIEGPDNVHTAKEPKTFDGSITFIEAADVREYYDATARGH